MVTFVDDQTPSHSGSSVGGDALCLVSAAFYAAYTVAIRRMLPEDESAPMMLFFGYVGLLNLTCLAPVLGVLALAGVVDLRALTAKLLGATVLKGNRCWGLGARGLELGSGVSAWGTWPGCAVEACLGWPVWLWFRWHQGRGVVAALWSMLEAAGRCCARLHGLAAQLWDAVAGA